MFEAFRNSIFRVGSHWVRSNAQSKYLSVSTKNNEAVVERYQFYKETEALQNVEDNLINATESRLNEFEKREFQVLRKYFSEGSHNPSVDARHVREQLDVVQVLRNLKLVETQSSDYDPEYVNFERIKARFLLEEEGAKEEFVAYVKERPYLKQYLKWADAQEQNQIKLWPLN